MKKLNYIIAFFAIFAIISGCSNDPSKTIVGSWKLTEIKTTEQIADDQKEMYNKMMDEIKATSSFVFKEDNTIETKFAEQVSKGTWEVSKDGKTLTIKDEKGNTSKATIKELTSTKFSFEEEKNGVVTTLVLEKK